MPLSLLLSVGLLILAILAIAVWGVAAVVGAAYRFNRATGKQPCPACGAALGAEAFNRADAAWAAHLEHLHRTHPGVRSRLLRTVHAICPQCGAQLQFDDSRGSFARAPEPLPEALSSAQTGARPRRRRRWPWLLAAVGLLIGGTAAWEHRPLNSTERMLVGTWERHDGTPAKDRLELAPDRTFTQTRLDPRIPSSPDRGVWNASDTSLRLNIDAYYTFPSHRRWRLFSLRSSLTDRFALRFDGPDRMWKEDVEFIRVGTEPPPSAQRSAAWYWYGGK